MDDKLSTKDAMTVLRNLQDWLYLSSINGGTRIQREAIDVAIEALNNCSEVKNSSDCISRQAAIDIAKELTITLDGYEMSNQAVMNYCAEIMQLPPIQPKRGRWRHYEQVLKCSECGSEFYDEITEYFGDDVPPFCPMCGADMRGEQDDG